MERIYERTLTYEKNIKSGGGWEERGVHKRYGLTELSAFLAEGFELPALSGVRNRAKERNE